MHLTQFRFGQNQQTDLRTPVEIVASIRKQQVPLTFIAESFDVFEIVPLRIGNGPHLDAGTVGIQGEEFRCIAAVIDGKVNPYVEKGRCQAAGLI